MSTTTIASLAATLDRIASDFFASARREWLDLLPARPDLAVLELGCGSGATGALALREKCCQTWIGIEANAAHAADALYAITDVHVGDPLTVELPYARGTFDVLFLGEALGGYEDPSLRLKRLVRLVRPGGRVFVSLTKLEGRAPFTSATVRRLLRRAGVKVESVRGAVAPGHRGWFTPRRYKCIEARGRVR
jgi:SAM-dependent methyltransferase